MTEGTRTLEEGLRDLGWTATADRVAAGDESLSMPPMVHDHLRRSVARKREFLAGHSYEPGTCGQETHERIEAWCERAEALLAEGATK